jgi:hypothetical protein
MEDRRRAASRLSVLVDQARRPTSMLFAIEIHIAALESAAPWFEKDALQGPFPCLIDASGQLAFVKNVFCLAQISFFRIPTDVTNAVGEMSLITHETIKIIALP